MNRTFATIALQSAIAAAILTIAPLAAADSSSDALTGVPTSFSSQVSREQVRQAAIEARDASLRSGVREETLRDPGSIPFVSTADRAQVRAEAIEAVRLGQTNRYEDQAHAAAAQLQPTRLLAAK